MNWQIGHKQRYLLFAALAVMVWILLPAQAAWADCGDTNPTVLCVDADASGTSDGLSWTNAYTNVRDAISVTHAYSTTNYEIWVAEGVYYPDEGVGTVADSEMMSFTLGYNNVQLYGGFAGIESARDQRDWAANITILSGDLDQDDTNTDGNYIAETWNDIQGSNAYHVLYLDGVTGENITPNTLIDGFTITAGQANGSNPHDRGGGLYCFGENSGNECSPTLTNVIFSGNQAVYLGGGGMFNYGGNSNNRSSGLINVIFSGNQAYYGGGMLNYGGYDGNSSPMLINVTFSGNQATDSGGGMYNYGSYGGNSSPVLINVTFGGNQADLRGGGMYNNGSNNDGVSSPALTNVILWGNTAVTGTQLYNDTATPSLNYTLIKSGTNDIYNTGIGGVIYGAGILTSDPLFVAPITAAAAPTTSGDYRLQAASLAIDAGDDGVVFVITDLDDNPRIMGRAVDIGAYEAYLILYLPLVLRSG